MVTAATVLLAGALLLAGSLRDDAYLVTVALGLSLGAVLVESVQVLRGRRVVAAPSPVVEPSPEPEPAPPVVERVETTPAPAVVEPSPVVEPVETTPVGEPRADPDPQPVRLPGRATYHRPDCPTLRGKEAVPVVAGIAPGGQTLTPCRRCRPPVPEEWAPWGSNPQPAD